MIEHLDNQRPAPMHHAQLSRGIEQTRLFYNQKQNVAAQSIVSEVQNIRDRMSEIPGFQAVFGLGYPFYAIDGTLPDTERVVAPVPAINDHIESAQQLINVSEDKFGSEWPCAGCQETHGLPDLKSQCKPCDKILFKPRDLFRALPDIDVVTLFKAPTRMTEVAVQSALKDMGLIQSDINIRASFSMAIQNLGESSQPKLPVDAHVWDVDDFEDHCQQLYDEPDRTDNVLVSRALHMDWVDHPLDFGFDFTFSLTEVGDIPDQVRDTIDITRHTIVNRLGEDALVGFIRKTSERGGAILEDPALLEIFKRRVSSWRSLPEAA